MNSIAPKILLTPTQIQRFVVIIVGSSALLPLGVQIPFAVLSLICIYSLTCDACAKRFRWSAYDAVVLWLFCCRPLSVLLNMLIHSEFDWAELDNPARFLYAIPVYLILRVTPGVNLFKALTAGLVVAALGGAIVAAWEVLTGGGRSEGFYNNPISFGNVMAITSCMLMGVAFAEANPLRRAMFITSSILSLAAVMTSQARGSLLIFGSLFFVLVASDNRLRNLALLLLGPVVGVLIAWYLGLSHRFVSAIEGAQCWFSSGSICDGSVSVRLETFYVAVNIWLENIWFGVGVGNTAGAFEKAISSGASVLGFRVFDHAHNELIGIVLEQGLLGIAVSGLFYLVLLGLIIQCSLSRGNSSDRHRRQLIANSGLVFACGFMLSGVSQVNSGHSDIASYFAVFTSFILAQSVNFATSDHLPDVRS